MPLHDHKCERCGKVEEKYVAVADLEKFQWCACGSLQHRVFLQPPMSFMGRDICYDSPIDGRPITSKAARIEDLRRNDCIEYEPGMRQDAARNRKQTEEQLDRAVESTVDEFVATAPTRKIEKLEQELRAGATAEVVRSAPTTT